MGPSTITNRLWYIKAFTNYDGTKIGVTEARSDSYLVFSVSNFCFKASERTAANFLNALRWSAPVSISESYEFKFVGNTKLLFWLPLEFTVFAYIDVLLSYSVFDGIVPELVPLGPQFAFRFSELFSKSESMFDFRIYYFISKNKSFIDKLKLLMLLWKYKYIANLSISSFKPLIRSNTYK